MKLSPRSQKLAGVVGEYLPTLIHRYLTPEDIGFLTISAIEISGDLSVADIFVSTLQIPVTKALKKLSKQSKALEEDLQKTLKLRRPLRLRFKEDKGVKHEERMRKLLDFEVGSTK